MFTLTAYFCDATGCFVKALPVGQNIVLDKSYNNSDRYKFMQAAVIVKLDFRNLKSTRNKNNKFLKYKISICLDHTYMYTVHE